MSYTDRVITAAITVVFVTLAFAATVGCIWLTWQLTLWALRFYNTPIIFCIFAKVFFFVYWIVASLCLCLWIKREVSE